MIYASRCPQAHQAPCRNPGHREAVITLLADAVVADAGPSLRPYALRPVRSRLSSHHQHEFRCAPPTSQRSIRLYSKHLIAPHSCYHLISVMRGSLQVFSKEWTSKITCSSKSLDRINANSPCHDASSYRSSRTCQSKIVKFEMIYGLEAIYTIQYDDGSKLNPSETP